MVLEQTNFATTHFVASSFPFRQEKSAPMDGLRQRPAIRSTIVQSHGYSAPIRQIISHGTGCSAPAVRSNFVTKPRKNREHACRWKGSSSAANVSTWSALSTQFAPGIRSTKGSRPGSAGPNLLPRCVVSNSSQKCMDAECDYQSNQGEHADGYQKNAEAFHVATGDCQHRGVSVSDIAIPRNITGTGYGGVDDLL